MPITINGSGTVSGLSPGGLPDACITTDDIAANAVTFPKIGTTEQGQLCKAWVNFNGTGTVAIRASYNVSSITDNGTGNYVINFSTPFADGNYSVCGSTDWAGVTVNQAVNIQNNSSQVATCQVITSAYDGTAFDNENVNVAIFR